MSGSLPYSSIVQNLLMQVVNMFNNIKSQYVQTNEVYLLNINGDELFHSQQDPIIDVSTITNDIDKNLKLDLHSPTNSDLRAILILNESNDDKKLHLNVKANIGINKAFALLKFNYSDFSLQNPTQLLMNANQKIDIDEKVELNLQQKDLLCVLVGNVNSLPDDDKTHISLSFVHKAKESYLPNMLVIGVIIIVVVVLILYLLIQSDEEEM